MNTRSWLEVNTCATFAAIGGELYVEVGYNRSITLERYSLTKFLRLASWKKCIAFSSKTIYAREPVKSRETTVCRQHCRSSGGLDVAIRLLIKPGWQLLESGQGFAYERGAVDSGLGVKTGNPTLQSGVLWGNSP